jgi:CDP-6-deoxy-D-xylo-4-hexulose-3-dehydrase
MTWRNEILATVREKYPTPDRRFVPGETYIPASGKLVDVDDLVALVDASLDLWLTAGRYAEQLERDFAAWLGTRWARLTNSGSSANLLAFAALTSPALKRHITPGSEVITVAAGFPTTVAPIVQHGCVPVFVDVDYRTHNLDVSQLDAALSERTRAIVVAHALGNPFDVTAVADFARRHDLWLIEDTCDALGATVDGRLCGTFGDLATVSFYPAHHMTMGEGGMVVGRSTHVQRAVESFRDWGRDCWCAPGKDDTCGKRFGWQFADMPAGYDHKYVYTHLGYNLKATDMQAAVGCSQLGKLPRFIERRRENHRFLACAFREAGLDRWFDLVEASRGSEPSWFGFVLSVREDSGLERNAVVQYLERRRIGTRLVFGGNLVRQPALQGVTYRTIGELPETDRVMRQSFWIGVWPGLGEPQLRYVVDTFSALVRDLRA